MQKQVIDISQNKNDTSLLLFQAKKKVNLHIRFKRSKICDMRLNAMMSHLNKFIMQVMMTMLMIRIVKLIIINL